MEKSSEEIRIMEIESLLRSMPKNRLLGGIKHSLRTEKRSLYKRIAKIKGSHTFSQAVELIKSVNGICAHCGDNKNPTIDHILPISKGGSDGLENLQVLCGSCNSKKGNRFNG